MSIIPNYSLLTTFREFHVSENLFKIANMLFIPNRWQKYEKKNHNSYSLKILLYKYNSSSVQVLYRVLFSCNSVKRLQTENARNDNGYPTIFLCYEQ